MIIFFDLYTLVQFKFYNNYIVSIEYALVNGNVKDALNLVQLDLSNGLIKTLYIKKPL